MFDFLEGQIDNIDHTELQNISPEEKQKVLRLVKKAFENAIAPHLQEIRTRSQSQYPDPETVRKKYANASDQKQEEIFHGTVQDLQTLGIQLRERPFEGFAELKAYLRDPRVTEALWLIFENPNISQGYRPQLKQYAGEQMFYLGAALVPEMYTDDELLRWMKDYGLDEQQRQQRLKQLRYSDNIEE